MRAQNRNRTCTPLPKQDFESSASTNSAIWAILLRTIPPKRDANIDTLSETPNAFLKIF